MIKLIEKLQETLKGKPRSTYVLLAGISVVIEATIIAVLSMLGGIFIILGIIVVCATIGYAIALVEENCD